MARDLPVTGFAKETVFRYADYDTPFWARDNSEAGRWHRVGDGAFQYMTTRPEGAWAELARAESLRTEEELALVRMPVWVIELFQQNLVDFSTFERAEEAGFEPDALIDDDYERCQDEGARLRKLGYAGVVAPSAAFAGAINVTIFGRRRLASWSRQTHLASAIRGCVAGRACPMPGPAAQVRHYGDAHEGYLRFVADQAARLRRDQVSDSGEPD